MKSHMAVSVLVLLLLISEVSSHIAMSGLEVSFHHMTMTIKDYDTDDIKLLSEIGVGHDWPSQTNSGFQACVSKESMVCVENPNIARFDLDRDGQCWTVSWTSLSCDFLPQDCLPLTGAYWYGGSELHDQYWPMNKQQNDMEPYVSGDLLQGPYYGSVLDRYWLSSSGIAVYVHNDVPLHVSWNANGDEKFCMKAAYQGDHYQNRHNRLPQLKYTICEASNAKEAHKLLFPQFYTIPSSLPDTRMLKSPVWSTWARYKMHVTEQDTMELAQEIIDHGFSNSQLEIDDKYTPTYGEFVFDPAKFPSGRDLITKLNDMGFRVTTWVTPFVNYDSPPFVEGVDKGYFLKDGIAAAPVLIKWWQGIGAALDVTNPDAVEWYINRLEQFKNDTGIDSFKFDAGENNWFPPGITTYQEMENPNDYTTKYVSALAKLGNMVETRVGYRSQEHPIFVRMMDKDSEWGYNNGLKTMIPNILQMSILGYPYCLPDMIGGNGYSSDIISLEASNLPSKELFIRWTQVSAYMTSMQFSFVPWQYDEETITIARNMVRVHEEVVYPLIIEAAEEMFTTGAPIIRPLWWHDPEDADAQSCDSQFLVGGRLLVAPVLDDGARARDVYLPAGLWKEGLRGGDKLIEGPLWIREYAVGLDEVATFWLQEHMDEDKEEL